MGLSLAIVFSLCLLTECACRRMTDASKERDRVLSLGTNGRTLQNDEKAPH
jgi:hypothetical protein